MKTDSHFVSSGVPIAATPIEDNAFASRAPRSTPIGQRVAAFHGCKLAQALPLHLEWVARLPGDERIVERLAPVIGDMAIHEVSDAWLEGRPVGAGVRPAPPLDAAQFRVVHSAIERAARHWGVSAELLPYNAAKAFAVLRGAHRGLPLDERHAVATALGIAEKREDRIALLVRLAGQTGARMGALIQAEWPQFAMAGAAPAWTFTCPKSGKAETIKLSPESLATLAILQAESAPNNPRVFHWVSHPRRALHAFHAFAASIGLRGMAFHEFRRVFRANK